LGGREGWEVEVERADVEEYMVEEERGKRGGGEGKWEREERERWRGLCGRREGEGRWGEGKGMKRGERESGKRTGREGKGREDGEGGTGREKRREGRAEGEVEMGRKRRVKWEREEMERSGGEERGTEKGDRERGKTRGRAGCSGACNWIRVCRASSTVGPVGIPEVLDKIFYGP
jgi:hypothetical protein